MPGQIRDIHLKLAPFLVTGLSGTALTPAERELLSGAPPAGVILFHRNVESAGQLRLLTEDIRTVIEAVSGLPPLIMADHEGGRISVLAAAIGAPPSQMASWNPRSVEVLAGITACTAFRMKLCGINVSLSPVADVVSEPLNPVIGTRSFGEDPATVSEAVRTAVRALAGEGMLSCLKHFPGHGATEVDSHLALPVINRTIEQLRDIELPPFVAGIEECADMVMTAHIALAGRGTPASLDRGIVTGLLREELGFRGVVITDALEMAGALPDGIAMRSIDPDVTGKAADAVPASVTAKALEAGNDLLLMSRPAEEVYAELALHEDSLGEALSGEEMAGLLERSGARITALREKVPVGITDASGPEPGDCREESLLMERIVPGAGTAGPALPAFLGYKRDFDSYVVKRFIFRVLDGLGRSGKGPEIPVAPDELTPVMTGERHESGLYLFEPFIEPDTPRSLVILCRRPPPREVILTLASSFDTIVAAGRPWDAGLVPGDSYVAVTYGIFDAAAEHVAALLRGL